MAIPKDWIVYIEQGTNETRALLAWLDQDASTLEAQGHKVIGYVSSGHEVDAIKYANEVLR